MPRFGHREPTIVDGGSDDVTSRAAAGLQSVEMKFVYDSYLNDTYTEYGLGMKF